MNNCKKFKRKILDYMENQLSEAEYRECDEHLQHCTSCQKEYASLKKLYGVLDRDEVVLPESEFFDDLKVKVRQKVILSKRPPIWKITRVLVPVAVAAALVLLLYQPHETTEIAIPISDILADREVASYVLSQIVDDDLISELTEVEDHFLPDVNEALDELTDDEKEEFIKELYKKYGIET